MNSTNTIKNLLNDLTVDIFKGTYHHSEFLTIHICKEAHITNTDGADFQIDGEVMETPKEIKACCFANQIKFFSNV